MSFGMGVVTGIVMAFQFGTNWGVLAERTGSIQGPLLGYEAFTAFMLEATFFGVMLLGPRPRLAGLLLLRLLHGVARHDVLLVLDPRQQSAGCRCRSATRSSTARSSPPTGATIVLGPVMMVRWPHMLLAAFLTTAMCVAATGAWYMLRGVHRAEARVMLHWGLGAGGGADPGAAVLRPPHGPLRAQAPAGEVRRDRGALAEPAAGSEVLIAMPDEASERNLFAIEIPKLGSFIASGNWTAREIGLETFPLEDRPPVLIPFFGFRIMVGMGLIMLGVSWLGNFLRWRGRLETTRWFLWATFLSFPTGFIAVLSGWYTAEVGRQPWVVYGLLRTRDAVTPSLTTGDVLFSLAVLRAGLCRLRLASASTTSTSCCARGRPSRPRRSRMRPRSRPLAFADTRRHGHRQPDRSREVSDDGTEHSSPCSGPAVIAAAILVYVILDGFDIGVGILFGTTRDEAHRVQMMTTHRAVLGRQRDLAGGDRRRASSRRFPAVYAVFLGAFYLPVLLMLVGLIFRGIAFEFRYRSAAHAPVLGRRILLRLDGGRLRPGRGGRRDDARHSGREHAIRRRRLRLAASVSRS